MPDEPFKDTPWLDALDAEQRSRISAYTEPGPPEAMLATLSQAEEIPRGWGFQRKWDGMRVLAATGDEEPRLWARSGRRVASSFPELTRRLAGVDREAILDGEIVVLMEGIERFDLLQRRMHVEDPSRSLIDQIPVQLALFDVLCLDGLDVRHLPQAKREQLLHGLLAQLPEVIVAETVAHGQPPGQVQEAACELGWEGVIAKDPDSSYRGGRQRAWRKLKCMVEATFTIVGYRDLEPTGGGVGSLVLAEASQQGSALVGSVGTGLTDAERARVHQMLQPLRRHEAPVDIDEGEVRGQVHWVEPEIDVEVAFSERTPEGKLRQPRLRGASALETRGAAP